jgi:hypothetical protein
MQYPDMKEIERRPKRYWNVDGLPDLVMGALWILWGLALALPSWLPSGSWLNYYWMVVPLILILSGFAANAITKILKQHLTFPRTGYVESIPPGAATKMAAAFLAAGVAAAIVLLGRSATVQGLEDLLPTAIALLFALLFLVMAMRQKLPHYLWSSALSLLLAGIIARNRMSLNNGFIFLLLSIGLCSCLVGSVRLYTYLRRNPRQQEGEA